jgi:hypothetical protein
MTKECQFESVKGYCLMIGCMLVDKPCKCKDKYGHPIYYWEKEKIKKMQKELKHARH